MADFEIYVFCDECSYMHSTGIRIGLNQGPVEKKSIGDLHKEEALPSNIVAIIKSHFRCPETGKRFVQEDNNKVLLFPV